MVKDALRGYLALASGVTEVTAARARSAARTLVEQGESTAGQVTALAEDLVATSRRNREGLVLIVRHEVEATLRRLGLGAAGDVDALNQRVRRLEQALRDAERGRGTSSTSGTTSTAAGSGSSRPKKTAKRSAKKSAAKKSVAKKSVAKKSATRTSTAKKSTARTSTPKKTAAKKSTAKKATAKRSTARKRTQKRSATKKSSASRRRS
jgi:polyhydroxyalkanoate synthesis regulator phasin